MIEEQANIFIRNNILESDSDFEENEADDDIIDDALISTEYVNLNGPTPPKINAVISEDGKSYNKLRNSDITQNRVTVPENLTQSFPSFVTPDADHQGQGYVS